MFVFSGKGTYTKGRNKASAAGASVRVRIDDNTMGTHFINTPSSPGDMVTAIALRAAYDTTRGV